MTSLFLAVFFLSSCGSASAASAPDPWDRLDETLAGLESAQAALQRCVGSREELKSKRAEAPRECRPKVSVDMVMVDPRFKDLFSTDLIARQVCRARSLKNPWPCQDLADLQGRQETAEHMCRRLYAMILFSQALIARTSDVTAACEGWCDMAPARPPPELAASVCESLGRGDIPLACNDIARWKHAEPGYAGKECAWEMRSVLGLGDEKSCGTPYFGAGSDVCVATSLFKKAKTAEGPKACGDDPICRAMLGEGPSACAALDSKIEERACSLPFFRTEAPLAARLGLLNEDCVSMRNRAAKRLDAAKRQLKAQERTGDNRLSSRQEALARLQARQKELEDAYSMP